MSYGASLFALFPGQGSQKVGMGRDLYEGSTVGKQIFERAGERLGFDLYKICIEGPTEKLTLTEIAQPAILTVSTILFELAREKVAPRVAAGHSLGEYSALVAAGAISFDDAVLLVHKRGRYMQEAVPAGRGKMVAILGKELSEIEEALKGTQSGVAEVANINSPGQVVVSGDKEGVDAFITALGTAKVVELPVSAPFHSSLMLPAQKRLEEDLKTLPIQPAAFPVYSNYSATPLTDPNEIRTALSHQVSGKVRWVECVRDGVARFGVTHGAEFGAGATLAGLMKRIEPSVKVHVVDSVESISKMSA